MALGTAELSNLAVAAGWTGDDVATAVAVAKAESGGDPAAMGDNGTSYGLWQIHLPAHPEFKGQNLLDPSTNAAAAHKVWLGAGWGAWSAYTNGAYLMYLPEAKATVGKTAPASGSRSSEPTPAERSALTQAGFLQTLTTVEFWSRALKVAIGGALILGTAYILARPVVAPVVAPAVKVAKKVAKAA